MNLLDIIYILSYTATFATTLVLFGGIVRWKSLTMPFKILFFGQLIYLLISIAAIILGKLSIRNLFLTHINSFVSICTLTLFLSKIFQDKLKSNIVLLIGVCGMLFILIDAFYITGINHLNTLSSLICGAIFNIIALVGLSNIITSHFIDKISNYPLFWIIAGILTTDVPDMFVKVFTNQMLAYSPELYMQILCIGFIFTIIGKILIFIGFWKTNKSFKKHVSL